MMQTEMGHFCDMKVKPSDLKPSVRQVKGRKPRKSQLWAKHDIDLDPAVYGKSRRTRGPVCSRVQYGLANEWGLKTEQYLRGSGLWDIRGDTDDWRVVNVITGETIGWGDCHMALSYRIAAARVGVTLEVYSE